MLRKVLICTPKETNSGKVVYQLTFDGQEEEAKRQGTSFDESFKDSVGKEFDVEFKVNPAYPQYQNVVLVGGKKNWKEGGKPFVPKNPKLEVLGLAVEFSKGKDRILHDGTVKEVKSADVLAIAKSWFEWINQKDA